MSKKSTTKTATPAKRAVKPARKTPPVIRKGAATKPARAVGKKTNDSNKPGSASTPGLTTDDVAMRAYFIAEKRRHHGQTGDERQDWIEAELQLLAEIKPAKSWCAPRPSRNRSPVGHIRCIKIELVAKCRQRLFFPAMIHSTDTRSALTAALRQRLAIIADRQFYQSNPAAHLTRLQEISHKILELSAQLPADTDPQLKHYLERASYDKALAFLETN